MNRNFHINNQTKDPGELVMGKSLVAGQLHGIGEDEFQQTGGKIDSPRKANKISSMGPASYVDDLPEHIQLRELRRAIVLNCWVERERQRQRLSASHFHTKSFYYHFLPVSLLTMSSGILSLFTVLEYDDKNEYETSRKMEAEMAVFIAGVLSFFTTFWNAIGGRANWSGKHEQHNLASLQLQRIDVELEAILITGVNTEEDKEKIRKLEDEVLGIPRNLTSLVPSEIAEAFTLLEMRMKTLFSTQQVIRNVYKEENELQKIAYGELSGVISSYYGFPLILPSPNYSVKKALLKIQKSIKSNATAFDDVENVLAKHIVSRSFYEERKELVDSDNTTTS